MALKMARMRTRSRGKSRLCGLGLHIIVLVYRLRTVTLQSSHIQHCTLDAFIFRSSYVSFFFFGWVILFSLSYGSIDLTQSCPTVARMQCLPALPPHLTMGSLHPLLCPLRYAHCRRELEGRSLVPGDTYGYSCASQSTLRRRIRFSIRIL